MSDSKTTFSFEHKILTPEPTNATLTQLKKELYANAMGTITELGGGNHGYLGIIMPAAEYLIETEGEIFMAPIKPVAPVRDDIRSYDEIAHDRDIYKEDLIEYKQHRAMGIELKEQLIAAIEYHYIKPMENGKCGLANRSTLDILNYLTTEYDQITMEDLEKNQAILTAKWNINDPILDLWERVKECQRFALEGGYPIADKIAISATLKVLEDTGVYILTTTIMRNKAQAEWNMVDFQTLFNKAEKERARQMTAKSAGFHGANMVTRKTPSYAAATIGTTPTTAQLIISPYTVIGPKGKPISYCYKHGYNFGMKHTSVTCMSKEAGHKDGATYFDNMDGCQDINLGPRPGRNNKNNTNSTGNNTTTNAAPTTTANLATGNINSAQNTNE
jgi:hypothetical protein